MPDKQGIVVRPVLSDFVAAHSCSWSLTREGNARLLPSFLLLASWPLLMLVCATATTPRLAARANKAGVRRTLRLQ